MKALVSAVNQEKALVVGAFSVIVKTDCGTDGALHRLVITARLAHCAGDKYTSLILGHTASSQQPGQNKYRRRRCLEIIILDKCQSFVGTFIKLIRF